MIIFKATKGNKTDKRLIYVEIDKGTMGLSKIREKIVGYNLYLQKGIHKKIDMNNIYVYICVCMCLCEYIYACLV